MGAEPGNCTHEGVALALCCQGYPCAQGLSTQQVLSEHTGVKSSVLLLPPLYT